MIELAILGLLREQDLHGYELKKQLVDLLGSRSSVSFGSLYPALARLERNGLVKAVEAATAVGKPVPSSGSLKGELAAFRARHPIRTPGGRGRKVYGITEQGRQQLLVLLADPHTADDRAFGVKVAFCGFLEPADRLALFERRRAELATRLADRRRAGRDREGRRDQYLRSLRDHDDASLTHDLMWLDELIATERGDRGEHATASLSPRTADGLPARAGTTEGTDS
jgi:DNA-binding PadR family transcriptional regulator